MEFLSIEIRRGYGISTEIQNVLNLRSCWRGRKSWLGITFDRKLSFKEYIRGVSQKVPRTTDHVKRLCCITLRASPATSLQATQGCVFPMLLYAFERWYSPLTPRWALNQIHYPINWATTAILPVYEITLISALLRETGLGPATVLLHRIKDHLAVRGAAVNPRYDG